MSLYDIIKDGLDQSDVKKEIVKYKEGGPESKYGDGVNSCLSLSTLDFFRVCRLVIQILKKEKIEKEPVIVFLDLNHRESILYVPIIVAIISTGNAFFVSDCSHIEEEARMVGSRVVIRTHGHPETLCDDNINIVVSQNIGINGCLPPDCAYIIKTSGTTGASKLVYVTNSSIVPNIKDIAAELQVTKRDIILMSSPPTFDPHIIDVFVSLMSGSTLLILSRQMMVANTKLNIEGVTILHCTPSLLNR